MAFFFQQEIIVPTSPLSVPGALLLIHSEAPEGNTSIVDSSSHSNSIPYRWSSYHTTVRAKFGSSSLTFDYDGFRANLPVTLTADNEWTIESWVYLDESSGGADRIIWQGLSNNASSSRMHLTFNDSYTLCIYLKNNYWVWAWAPPLNEWIHIAITRKDGVTKLWGNGVLRSTRVDDGSYYDWGNQIQVGEGKSHGWVEELRVLDFAAYTEDFIPPTGPFTL